MRVCLPYQLFARKHKLTTLPLNPMVVEEPFEQWGLYFIGEIKDNSSNGFKWKIMASNYFTIWVESIPTKREIDKVVMEFLENKIIRFGIPLKIIMNNTKEFKYMKLYNFYFYYGTVLSHPSNYYPQGNGLANSSDKNLMEIIKKDCRGK
jgi:hypothetical protein